MKKYIFYITIILFVVSIFSSCNNTKSEYDWQKVSSKEKTQYYQESFIACLNNKDANEMRELFAPSLRNYLGDFRKGTDYIFSMFKGRIENVDYDKDVGLEMTAHLSFSSRKKNIDFVFTYKGSQYRVYMNICDYVDYSYEDEGILRVVVMKVENKKSEEKFKQLCGLQRYGIYYPDWEKD